MQNSIGKFLSEIPFLNFSGKFDYKISSENAIPKCCWKIPFDNLAAEFLWKIPLQSFFGKLVRNFFEKFCAKFFLENTIVRIL